jgi:hypothetical protein
MRPPPIAILLESLLSRHAPKGAGASLPASNQNGMRLVPRIPFV